MALDARDSQRNWSGHVGFRRAAFHEPTSVAEVQDIVGSADRVRVIGARHSFNDVADTDGDLLWLGGLPLDLRLDRDRMTASFGAGATYEQLGPLLHDAGLALANTASLMHITVAGACATGTHGSGDRLGNLATSVTGLEVVTADGELRTLTRGIDDAFDGAVVSLGALGVVTRLTVEVEPTYDIRQDLYVDLPFDDLYADFDIVVSAGYSVSLFPTYQQPRCETVLVKQRAGTTSAPWRPPAPRLLSAERRDDWARPARHDRTRSPLNEPGPWHERMPHFSLLDPPAKGTELQSEYFVDRQVAPDAIREVAALGPELAGVLELCEIRTMTADRLWLSPAFGRDTVGIHFNWYEQPDRVAALLPIVEAVLLPFDPRPHWGKLFALPSSHIEAVYPRIDDFRALRDRLDPSDTFVNDYLRRHVMASP